MASSPRARRQSLSGVTSPGQPLAQAPAAVDDRARQLDRLLVRRCRSGDAAAWSEIVERFSGYVYAIATGYGLHDDRAEEVFQEVFVRAFVHLGSLRDEGALRPWIAQLTRRAAIDRLRADRRNFPAVPDIELGAEDPEFHEIELAMTVRCALDELPAPFADALKRFFLEDESYRTIGDALGVPGGTVASRIARGLSQLRELLDEGQGNRS